jgi:hypothetical protein
MRPAAAKLLLAGLTALALSVPTSGLAVEPPVGMPLDCTGSGPFVAHPKSFAFSCDGHIVFTNARWTDWGAPVAHGTSILWLGTSCTPNCAQAPRKRYVAKLTASNIVYCHERQRIYGTVVARFAGYRLVGAPPVCSAT